MSDEEIIPLETFCSFYQVERSFIETLESHGLISIQLPGKSTIYFKG